MSTIEKYLKSCEERTNTFKSLSEITKNLDSSFLSLKKYQDKYDIDNQIDDFSKNKKEDFFEKLYEINKSYNENINTKVLDKLKVKIYFFYK